MILTRRKFIQRLAYMMAGGLIVPYVPKVFYSIPGPVVETVTTHIDMKFLNDPVEEAEMFLKISGRWKEIVGTGSWKMGSKGIKEFMNQ